MKEFTQNDLRHFNPTFGTFVGIDSDGCVFDTMETKQKDFFHPAIIRHWQLESIEPEVRQVAEFVYLYSIHRGLNRFLGLCHVFEHLQKWSKTKNFPNRPNPADLRTFCNSGLPLSNESILAEAHRTHSPLLQKIYGWSIQLNRDIDQKMPSPPPFQGSEKALQLIAQKSDAIVISQTQAIALLKDWYRDNFAQYVSVIAGAELGSKIDHFKMAALPHYSPERILMIGDAPGDQATAQAIGCAFFPIRPQHEQESWQQFIDEAYPRFLANDFSPAYQQKLNQAFNALLPETPPWEA
jgi:phosphoglycolate phosphatase-like HAD superfamily hydrolase